MALDLVIRGGTVVTEEMTMRADVGIEGEKVAQIGSDLAGKKTIDAAGKLVLPGGVDSHCHVEQLSSTGKMCADDFYSATVAAVFGGTTTIIPFAAQHRGNSIVAVVDDYARRAATAGPRPTAVCFRLSLPRSPEPCRNRMTGRGAPESPRGTKTR